MVAAQDDIINKFGKTPGAGGKAPPAITVA
jgi:hypothetical protein